MGDDGQLYEWENQGSITSQQDALGADKSAATVDALDDAKKIIYEATYRTVSVEMRFKGDMVDGQTNVIDMLAMRGASDDYIPIATLTITTGTQTDGVNLYVDKIVDTVKFQWPSNVEIMSNENNGIARVAWNIHRYRKFLFIATTLNSNSILIDTSRIG